NLRPIRRLTAKKVFLGLVTAWRLAEAPTITSPSLVKATIEGVVRSPSEVSMTLALPPSMMATQLLVVPRSMTIILPIVCLRNVSLSDGGVRPRLDLMSRRRPALQGRRIHPSYSPPGDDDHGRAQQARVERIALLEHPDHG